MADNYPKWFENPLPGRFRVTAQASVIRLLLKNRWVSKKISLVGELLQFQSWVGEIFSDSIFRNSREQVWSDLARTVSPNSSLRVCEFGVAYGYMTNHWFTFHNDVIEVWNGFDLFTGLPRSWRHMEKHAFDVGGKTPPISDSRVRWWVGDIGETLPTAIDNGLLEANESKSLFVFDLDLLEPTEIAWKLIEPQLNVGDLLYFDEAFDADERHVLENLVLKSAWKFRAISHSAQAIGFEAVGREDRLT